jgi:F-type H+-transporting ATPase subunit b
MANSTETTTAQSTTAEVGHKAFPPFDSSTFASQLLWFAIIFGAMYYYLSRRYLPAVGRLIDTRRARIAKDIGEATDLHLQAQAAGAEQDKAIARARADGQSNAQAARDKIAAETNERRKALEGDLNAKLGQAEARIAANRTAAMANVASIAEGATGAIVERLIGRAPDAASVQKAVKTAANAGA